MVLSIDDAMRYMGAGKAGPETRAMTEKTAAELTARIQPKYTWRAFRMERGNGGIFLPEAGITLAGKLAENMLAECDTVILAACTIGAEFDAMLRAREARDMAEAVVLDACGSAWAEAGCDAAEEEIAARVPDRWRTDRFSPGYGDLPLDLQGDLLRALDTGRRLGLSANASHLLTPSKSVTAIIGLSDRPQGAKIRGCGYCGLRENCAYRKRGTVCGV